MTWLQENGWQAGALVVLAAGICALMPRARSRTRMIGLLLALAGTGIALWSLPSPTGDNTTTVLFWFFAASAIFCAVLMITSRNPVYAALWFALVTLATCGLFLLQSAAFLAAATIIVYAGAIIVTFLFVIMLAQQAGATTYDQHANHPLLASIAAFVMLGALLATLRSDAWPQPADATAERVEVAALVAPNSLSRDLGADGKMTSLGRSLFGDYLYAVELAGTALLVASIGAIAIAPRRAQGTL